MANIPSTYAVDTGNKLSNGMHDIRWLATPGVIPEKRWFVAGEELPKGESEPQEWGSATVDSDGRLVVSYYRQEVFGPPENAPKLWFVLVDGRNKTPQQMTLFSYWDDTYPPGTVVEEKEVLSKIDKKHQGSWAGMVSWFVGDPILQQVITAPQHRRKRVAIMMFGICDIVNACYGLSPGLVLHGGSVTTEDGEKLRSIYPQSVRMDPRQGEFKP